MKPKLRIGVFINDFYQPLWTRKMLDQLINSNFCEIVLIVKNKSVKNKSKLSQKFSKILYVLYRKFDRYFFKNNIDLFKSEFYNFPNEVDVLEINPKQTKFRDEFNENDIREIIKYKTDVIIRLGFRIISGKILDIPKFGIWSYHHGDNKFNRGGPPGFWEVIKKIPNTGITLQILNENLDNGLIIHKTYSKTHEYSVNRNINSFYSKSISLIPDKLKELYNYGENKFFKKINKNNDSPYFYSFPLYKAPNNKKIIIPLIGLFFRFLKLKFYKILKINQWILMYRINEKNKFSSSMFSFKKMIPPKDRFWADPFIYTSENKNYIFIEEYIYKNKKGIISVIEMDQKGNYSNPKKVLEENYHLSYPFLIEDNNKIYLIPESKSNKSIDLYECVDFPLKWRKKITLISNLKAVDSTILRFQGKYWLFANIERNEGSSSFDELHLFYSDTLLSSNWISHPQNPISSSVNNARPAGNIFSYNNELYRPSQDCSKHYGYGIKFNRIDILNENQFSETEIDFIEPNWNDKVISTHTFNFSKSLTIIDAQMMRNRFF